jgi:putative endonuclease
MTTAKQSLGRWGEELAVKYLSENGYTIVARNYHTKHGELDIIAQKDDLIYFVEVKTRSNSAYGFPEEAVTPRKQSHMMMAAESFFKSHPMGFETWQFDIIAILKRTGQEAEIVHIQNVISS